MSTPAADLPIPGNPADPAEQVVANSPPPFALSDEDVDILRSALPASAKGQEEDCLTWWRELPKLLAEGHLGRFAIIHGGRLISVWDTQDDALQAGYDKFGVPRTFIAAKVEQRDYNRLQQFLAQERKKRCRG